MQRVLVADDLTGASDAGVQLAKAGLRTTVWLDPAAVVEAPDADVVVLDMDSRAASAEHAYAGMQALVRSLAGCAPRAILKKMDSTLRGNPGVEVRALLEALPTATALVCPAYPKNGRTCRDGVLWVHGVRVDQTDFAHDLFSPVRDARVAAHFDAPSIPLSLDAVRGSPAALVDTVERARASGARIVIADAETDDDLRAIAALHGLRDDLLWVGSAGLLEALDLGAQDSDAPPALPVANGPIAFVVGSISAMSQRQIAAFVAERAGHVELLDPIELLDDGSVIARAGIRAVHAFERGLDTMLALAGARDQVEAALRYGAARGWDARETSRRLRHALVGTVDACVHTDRAATIVLSGGDVARAFCERRGIRGMTLLAEVAPGIPISRAIGAKLLLVTKAGGFGRPDTFRDLAATLHAQVTA